MKYVPWIIVAITSTIAAGLLLRGPNVVTREVPFEVIKTVTKEVPVEVIKIVTKEVPIEVIKTVTKEVERQLTSQETYAIKQHELLTTAPFWNKPSDILKGMLILRLEVVLDEKLKTKWSQSEIEEKFKLELRKIGIEVVKVDDPRWRGSLSVSGGAFITDSGTTVYTLTWSISARVTTMQWDLNYLMWNAVHAQGTAYGQFGSAAAANAQRAAVDSCLVELSNQLLEANPIKRN